MVAGVAALMVWQQRRPEPVPQPVVPAPVVPTKVEFLDDVRIEVESLLLRSGFSLSSIRDDLVFETLRFEVSGPYPAPHLMESFRSRLRRISQELQIYALPDEGRFRVDLEGETLCRVRFVTQEEEAKPSYRVAIIMDDLGRNLSRARRLLDLDLAVTFSILPGEPHAARTAALAHDRQREVLIHIPMEPQGYPAMDPGDDALLVHHSAAEIRRRFAGYVESVPFAVGGNNHMGSRYTEHAPGMAVVLDIMDKNRLFFVDSRTSGGSVGYRMALDSGMASASRDVFLDNVQQVGLIRDQIDKLISLARRRGEAVGICHPYPETLEALRLEAERLSGGEVELVPVSQLLHRR